LRRSRNVWETTFEDLCRLARDKDLNAREFIQRRSEFKVVFHNVQVPVGRSLEVGCGDGFLTALLAREGKLSAGVEMAAPDLRTYSQGLARPVGLRRALDAPNLYYVGCSGENLCFADGTFDLVLSSYVLEHVGDRPQAIREMKRVAKEDGVIVALVPSWMERIYAPFHYYPAMVWGILRSGLRFLGQRMKALRKEDGRLPSGSSSPASARRERGREGFGDKLRKFLRVYHQTFPFPSPHGLYRSSSEEMLSHRLGHWAGLFEREGLVIERAFATRLAPTCLLEMISDGADRAVQKSLVGLLKRYGERPCVLAVAYSICVVLRKGSASAA
jgi:SAM-dependent methyltransferase